MERYREEYKDYYDKIRRKVKGKTPVNNKINSAREDIYPSARNVQDFTYRRGSYGMNTAKKNMGYIDKFILRLICTFILFLAVFTLKTVPNTEANKIYKICKGAVTSNFQYDTLLVGMEKMGIDYKSVFNIIEEKYTDVMGEIKELEL
ncbi:hypothetical protein SDC9_55199 [bioreactor metagenome]|uniref:Uncharacterized protein n=1 Tax=bioreactor metagenome TaxID=1076179 RepID=A0A644X3K8_9ZZZZ